MSLNLFVYRYCIIILLTVLFSLPTGKNVYAGNSLKELYQRATLAFQQEQYDEAINLYNLVIELNPDFPQVYNALGMIYEKKNNYPEAVRYYRLAIGIDNSFALAYLNLCKAHYKLSQFEESIDICHKALEFNPNLVEAKLNLAWGYLLGRAEPRIAINYFEEVLAVVDIPLAHYGIGLAYLTDNQRLKVFDSVTKLKAAGLESMALRLEEYLREGRDYVLAKGGRVIEEVVHESQEFSYKGYSENQLKSIPVRLRGELPNQ